LDIPIPQPFATCHWACSDVNLFKQVWLDVSGFPASDFTAIPVDSGFSDYYGSYVTLGDFQDHISQRFHSPFGPSPLGNPHLVIMKWAYCVVGWDFRRFPLSCGSGLFRISRGVWVRNTPSGTLASISSSMRGGLLSPTSGYPAGSLAFILVHNVLPLRVFVKYVKFVPHPRHAADFSTPTRHATLPVRFPISDKSRGNGLWLFATW